MKRFGLIVVMMAIAAPAFAAAANDVIANAARENGAIQTASGMVYKSIKDGSGPSPKASSVVGVDYRGTLPNGREFDSSYNSKMVTKFPLSSVIPCWTEGLQMMKVGGKAKLVCPPELAYGSRGAGQAIPPNATLIFEVELLSIE
ncbi:peptidylprolyl cis-trans isomerase, FKBP-type [Citrifermentans bemidjiense Bem]|uniref:Peptidyl-prolyl cis-trans isomerase n=1 Tax=Citrifermentans bemidjiense (strain ATCC BAA-1014 / DSM 16622 / JCM 12645 / Bem) TaxID=404380 RepID=B5E8F3_CITBB|nr:FKBP-type peptidyl-prolyl cis-trans isomerase [Citrifermentans bemidjiense]ACH37136.1 peptidylprolyl cis-trans isomerase, FKBP-type [Citrifermentans bemidjiense Bem]